VNASELIAKLQALIDEHGDLPVVVLDYSTGAVVSINHEPRIVHPARVDGAQALPGGDCILVQVW
jgi:phage tail sheath gpL-like